MSADNSIEVFLLKSKEMEPPNLQKDWVTGVILFPNTTPSIVNCCFGTQKCTIILLLSRRIKRKWGLLRLTPHWRYLKQISLENSICNSWDSESPPNHLSLTLLRKSSGTPQHCVCSSGKTAPLSRAVMVMMEQCWIGQRFRRQE